MRFFKARDLELPQPRPREWRGDPAAIRRFAAVFRAMPELKTQRLLLRAPRIRDAGDVFAYSRDPEVARFVMWEPHQSVGESRSFLRSLQKKNREGQPGTFIIEDKQSGRAVGTIGFMWIDADHSSCEIGYSLARSCWNRGYMTEALKEVIRFSFETLRLNRVEGQHDVRNPASGAVMRHAGMRCEGLLRQRLFNKGSFADVMLYAILRKDWDEDRSGPQTPAPCAGSACPPSGD